MKLENGNKKIDIVENGKKNEAEDKHEDPPFLKKMKETFDLDLLKDSVYLNVIIGLSLYYVAESNFKLMTPFFLSSIGKKHFLESFEIGAVANGCF